MKTEPEEPDDRFYECELKNKHVYDCELCEHYHVLDDDGDIFVCPVTAAEGDTSAVLFNPGEVPDDT